MNDDKKPREFWIHRESLADNDIDAVYSQCWVAKSPVDEDDCYNVIEKSAYDALAKENERLKEKLSYLPKVPTQPYEKEMAKQIFNLQKENEELRHKIADINKWCPCGGIILADTEDWPVPLCNACYEFVYKEARK